MRRAFSTWFSFGDKQNFASTRKPSPRELLVDLKAAAEFLSCAIFQNVIEE